MHMYVIHMFAHLYVVCIVSLVGLSSRSLLLSSRSLLTGGLSSIYTYYMYRRALVAILAEVCVCVCVVCVCVCVCLTHTHTHTLIAA